MRRLALLLALLTALGPSSLRWLHEATAHGHTDTHEAACGDAHHHDHDAEHHANGAHEGDKPAAPAHEHGCAVCDALASLTPSEAPVLALTLPAARPAFDASAPLVAHKPTPLAALRAMPPPAV